MRTDYRDAAERHWEDADDLLANSRAANADHLFGLSAECSLKAVMLGLGMPMGEEAPAQRRHRVHINILWDRFIAFAEGRDGARYALAIHAAANPFADWDVNQRYFHRSHISHDAATKHREWAETAIDVLRSAVLNGVVL
jgi:hypothetical protein